MKFPHHLRTLCSLAILFFVCGCGPGKPGVWKNDQIAAGKRNDLHKLNDQVLQILKDDDPKKLRDMISADLLDQNPYRTVDLISLRLKANPYHILDEYYIVNKYRDMDTINNKEEGLGTYRIIYPGVCKEMYVAFCVPTTPDDQWMIAAFYAKFDYGWKLCNLTLGPYTRNSKTTPQLYQTALDRYNKKYYIDAYENLVLAGKVSHPASVWTYTHEEKMAKFYARLSKTVDSLYKFPLALKQVKTHPVIFRLFNQELDNVTYPMIYYYTSIKLKDTTAVKRENAEIQRVIGTVFAGIDKNKKYVLYSAFNKLPQYGTTVEHFDINDKLK